MSVSSDSCTYEGDTVDSNIKIQINDITPSNSHEFLHTISSWEEDAAFSQFSSRTKTERQRKKGVGITWQRKKMAKKVLVRRQSWSAMPEDVKMPGSQLQKCWSLSSLDSEAEDIFYDARDGPSSPLNVYKSRDERSHSIPDALQKQRSLSAGSREDVRVAVCSQVTDVIQNMNTSPAKTQSVKPEKKHSLVILGNNSPTNEDWLLAPRTPLQKSVSTPSIIAAQEIQEMAHRRDRDGRERMTFSLFTSHRLSLHNVRDTSISMLQEEDESEEPTNRIPPQFSLANIFRENLLGGNQDSDDDKPFSKRKKRSSLFFRKKKNKDKDKEAKKTKPHQFVSICYSTSAVCDVCSKALANKSAVRCENCLVTIHDNACKDHVPECKSRLLKMPISKDKSILPTFQVSLGQIRYPSRYRHLLGPLSQSMTDLASGKSSQQPKEKRLSVGNNNRPQSLSMTTSTSDLAKTNTPPTSTPRKNFAPSGYSQWRRVATKLGVNKVICEEKESEPVDDMCSNLMETNSASMESLEEANQDVSDVEDDLLFMLTYDEPEAWNASVDKKYLKKLKERDVKRQEAIYELILTEKHHCLTLNIMQKVFARGMVKELCYSKERVERIFPCLEELLDMHMAFLYKLRERQKQDCVVSGIGDILLEQFQNNLAEQIRSCYSQFCSQHKEAVSLYKDILKSDRKFQAFIKKCNSKPLCKARGIPECILLVTQRVTKYPLLLDALIKTSKENKFELEALNKALVYIKNIITDVNSAVAEKEREERLLEIYNKIDAKATAVYKNKKFKKSDLIRSDSRKLQFEGPLAWKSAKGKTIDVHAIILSDIIVLLQETNQKYYFASLDNKSAVVSLQKLLVREKAGQNSRGIYLISSNPNDPEMYELLCPSNKEKRAWIQRIRESVEKCPEEIFFALSEEGLDDSSDGHGKQENKQRKLKDLFRIMYEKDLNIAHLCEEKVRMLIDTLELMGFATDEIEQFHYGSLLQKDEEDTKQLLLTSVNSAIQLVNCLYASGSNLNRSVSSAGEHQSSAYVSPTLPKRAETFSGFDNSSKDSASKILLLKKKIPIFKEYGHDGERELSFSDSNLHRKCSSSQDTPILGSKQNSPQEKPKHCLSSGTLSPKSATAFPFQFNSASYPNFTDMSHSEIFVELSHHMNVITCLLNHHFSSVQSSYAKFSEMSEKSGKAKDQSGEKRERRSIYRPDHQLEELRNIQEQLNEERTKWQAERSQQEKELGKKKEELLLLQAQVHKEQSQLNSQKEQLNKQLDVLQKGGITLSPSFYGESTSDDDSSCLDVSLHRPRQGGSFCLRSSENLIELSASRQSWSGPGSEEQRHLPAPQFLTSLSTSNLPYAVDNSSHLQFRTKPCHQETQWYEADCNFKFSLNSDDHVNSTNGCHVGSKSVAVLNEFNESSVGKKMSSTAENCCAQNEYLLANSNSSPTQ